jgi:adenosylmethionine-8-amino-7-oxononanoate aminotransferase
VSDFIVLGTDTDAGKTTFALLWLAAFGGAYAYWKPLESGSSDSDNVRALVPGVTVHAPLASFRNAVAPLLAARGEGATIPSAAMIANARPPSSAAGGPALLIETFGGPFSPLNDGELQLALIQRLALPCVLVTPATVGAIGRTLQCLAALETHHVFPAAVVLLGVADPFAVEQLTRRQPRLSVFSLEPPAAWQPDAVAAAAHRQRGTLLALRLCLSTPPLDLSAAWVERDRRAVWHPYTSLGDPDAPLVAVAAQDEFLTLADGRRVVDGISSWWTILHGHRHPTLMAALRRASADFDHVHFAGVTHPPAVALAELLLRSVAWPAGGRVFYSDNGSTAVEVALKLAYQYWCHQNEPQRTRFIGFAHGYHGDTFGAMAVSRDPVFFGRFEPLLFAADIIPLDANQLDDALTRRRGEVAAVLLEPLVQGAGGMRVHGPAELRAVAEVARRHDVLFIADEVMTCGRTGTVWAHTAAGVAPDLICVAKTLAGGMLPLAATLAAPHVAAAWQTSDPARTFFHGHSFTAHPLACAVALASWALLTGDGPQQAQRIEAFWREHLTPLRDLPRVKDVRVRGSIAAVELDVAGGYLATVGRDLRRRCLEQGVLLRPLGNVLYALPPLGTPVESLRRIADAVAAAVA